MKTNEKLVEARKIKEKMPNYTRSDNHKKPKLGNAWRRPKGWQNKIRLNKRGYKKAPSTGWRTAGEIRGLTAEGLQPVLVSSVTELNNISPQQTIILASSIGAKKRTEMFKIIKEKKLNVYGTNIEEAEKKISAAIMERKLKRQERAKKEAESKKQSKKETKKEEKKETKEEVKTDEEKKAEEKKEKDKLLTQKE